MKTMILKCPMCNSEIAVDVKHGLLATFDIDCDCGMVIKGKIQLAPPKNCARIVMIHPRHFTIVNDRVTPIKRLWEVSIPFGYLTGRNPRRECETWLLKNGYTKIDNGDVWTA